jgi:hypothetical protein
MPSGSVKPTSANLSEILERLIEASVDFILVGGRSQGKWKQLIKTKTFFIIEDKMRRIIRTTCFLSLIFFLVHSSCLAQDDKNNDENEDTIEIVTDYTYTIAPSDSPKKYEALALFGAKYKAVVLGSKYLSHRGLLESCGKNQKAIFCLAVDELKSDVIEKRLLENGGSYFVKIKSKVNDADFIRAEIKNTRLEKDEVHFSLQKKMEQHVYKSIDPALELSRAYRYIGRMRWRISLIYLDHLERKYPNWSEIYLAKAIAFYAIHEIQSMMEALNTSCVLGNREACEDLEGLRTPDKNIEPN